MKCNKSRCTYGSINIINAKIVLVPISHFASSSTETRRSYTPRISLFLIILLACTFPQNSPHIISSDLFSDLNQIASYFPVFVTILYILHNAHLLFEHIVRNQINSTNSLWPPHIICSKFIKKQVVGIFLFLVIWTKGKNGTYFTTAYWQ